MPLMLEIKPAEGPVSRIGLQPGRNRFSVRAGDSFRIYDDRTGLTPDGVSVKRIDNSLVVDGLLASAAEPTVVEFAEFYTLCSAGSPCQLLVQEQAARDPVAITPGSPSIGALSDGAFVLYDPSYVAPEPVAGPGGVDMRTVMYGLGGLAIAGLAASGGGGGGGSTAVSGNSGEEPTPDAVLKLTSSTFVNSRTPVINGEGEPGARVLVRIDTDGDGSPNVTYAATVGSDFRWSINLATAVPEGGSLPPGGIPDISTVGITSSSPDGIVSLPPFQLAFDGTPPAPALIAAVATDNVVNGPEKQAGVTVSGTAETGGSVLLTWGMQSTTVGVDAAGGWQTTFAAAAVPADGDYAITAIAQDRAGNSAVATQATVSVNTVPPALVIGSVAGGDNRVAIADAAKVEFAGSTDPGATVNLQWNGLSKVTTAGSTGQWSLAFADSEVPLSGGADFGYSIVATNAVGNVVAADGVVHVDRQAPGAPLFGLVEGDNMVSLAERGDGVPVNGSSEAGARIDVAWGNASKRGAADDNGIWAVHFNAGEVPSVGSPGANTTITATATDIADNKGGAGSVVVFVQQPFPPPIITTVAGNDVVSLAERNAGVTLSGSAHPDAPGITVTWGGFSRSVGVANGSWRVDVAPGQVPGDGASTVVASITGSPQIAASRQVSIDTTAPAAPAIGAVEGDNAVSVAERADGVVIAGTAEAGARVSVSWNGLDKTATANGGGAWLVDYGTGEVPTVGTGGGNTLVTATATDGVGNTSPVAQRAVFVAQPFSAPTVNVVEGNDVVNLAERANGVPLSGTVQAGAPGVNVTWGGFSGAALVSGTSWSVDVPAGQVPADGVTTVTATITGAGGGAAATRAVTVDTVAPAAPVVNPVTTIGPDSISLLEELVGVSVSGTAEANSIVIVQLGIESRVVTAGANGAWTTDTPAGRFTEAEIPASTPLPLLVTATDAANNSSTATQRSIVVEVAIELPLSLSLASTEADQRVTAIQMRDLLPGDATAPSQPGFLGDTGALSAANFASQSASLASQLIDDPQTSGRYA